MRNVLYSEKVLYSNSSCTYEDSHEPEAIGINIIMKPTTLFAIYLLDFVLPQVFKLSKWLQTEKLGLSPRYIL